MSGADTPKHWSKVPLGELVSAIEAGKSFRCIEKPPLEGMPGVVKVSAVTWGTFDEQESKTCPDPRQFDPKFEIRTGDFLISRANTLELVGACVIVGSLTKRLMLSDKILRIVMPEEFKRWVLWYLRSKAGRAEIEARATGNQLSMRNIGQDGIRAIEIPVAPVGVQQRTVEAIESYFTRLEDATATLERVQRNLKRYRASVLKAAVEGRLVPTEAELARAEGRDYEPASVLLERIHAERRRRWEENELAKMKANGRTPTSDAWKEAYQPPDAINMTRLPELPEGWTWTSVDAVGDVLLGRQRAPQFLTGRFTRPYLRVANIKDDRIEFDDLEEMDFDPGHFMKYQLQPGDILVSEGQSPELLGQSAIYRGGVDGLCFQKTLHRFRPVERGPSSEYAQLVFRAHVKSGVFMRLGSITTNIAHLTLVKFKGAPFPLPPANEQKRITAETHRILSEIDEAERVVDKQLVRLTRLRQSILKWAFEGRLVDQDPTDEPASVLLERIKAERAASATTTSNRKPRRKGNSANA